MTVSIPPLTLQASAPQTNVTSYSTDPDDHPILEKLSSHLPSLTEDALVSLSIIALKEGYEPVAIQVDYGYGCNIFNRCIELIQDLSQAGKVALVRSITELLAAPHITSDVALPVLPLVPPTHPENAWCMLSIDQAISFAKAGRMDPAILAWGFSQQSYTVIPPDLLAAANESLPGLLESLTPPLQNEVTNDANPR